MIDEGINPFGSTKTFNKSQQESADDLAGEDTELLEVVDAFEAE